MLDIAREGLNVNHYFFVPPKTNFDRFPIFLNLPYLEKNVTKELMNRKLTREKSTTPEKIRSILKVDELLAKINDGTFHSETEEDREEISAIVDFLHPQFAAESPYFSEFFKSCFKPSEIFTIISANVYNGTLFFSYNDFCGFLLHGLFGHYFLNSFGHCQRIDPTQLKLSDPFTRFRIRERNRQHPHLREIYFTNDFDLKKFIFMASENLFQTSSLNINPWGNPAQIVYLHLLEAMFSFGLFEESDVPQVLKVLSNVTLALSNMEENEKKDGSKDSFNVLSRQYFLYIVIHVITLTNDNAVLKFMKSGSETAPRTPNPNEVIPGTIFDNQERAVSLIQMCFDFPVGAHVVEFLHWDHMKLFTNEILSFYIDDPLDSYALSLKALNEEAFKEPKETHSELKSAQEVLRRVHFSVLNNLFFNKQVLQRDPDEELDSAKKLKLILDEIEKADLKSLAQFTTISEYLLWLLENLQTLDAINSKEQVFDLLKSIVVLNRTSASLLFSVQSMSLLKRVNRKYSPELLDLFLTISQAHGGEFFLHHGKVVEFMESFMRQYLSDISPGLPENALQCVTTCCRFLADVLGSGVKGENYEELCAKIQKTMIPSFMKAVWPVLFKEESYEEYSPDWEVQKQKNLKLNFLLASLSSLQLLVASTSRIVTQEVSMAIQSNELLGLLADSFLVQNPKYFSVLADLVLLMKNVSLFKLNTYSGINIGEIVVEEMQNSMDRLEKTEWRRSKLPVGQMLSVLGEILSKSEAILKFFKSCSPDLEKLLKIKSERLFLGTVYQALKGLLVSCFYHSFKTLDPDNLISSIESFLETFSNAWDHFGEIFGVSSEALKTQYRPDQIPKEFVIKDKSLLDQKEKENPKLLRMRLMVSHALDSIESLLSEKPEIKSESQRDFLNEFQRLKDHLPSPPASPVKLQKPSMEAQEHPLVSAYQNTKSKFYKESTATLIVSAWNKSIGDSFKKSVNHFVSYGLKQNTNPESNSTWFYSKELYAYIQLLEFLVSKMGFGFIQSIFEEKCLMQEAGQLGDYFSNVGTGLREVPPDEGQSKMERDPGSTSLLIIDRLHQLHMCYFYRVFFKHFHEDVFLSWRTRFHSVSRLFQSLCETDFHKFKVLFGTRRCPGTRHPMSRSVHKAFNSLIREDILKVGEFESVWHITEAKNKELGPLDRPELTPEIIQTLEFLSSLLKGPCSVNQELLYKYNSYMYFKIYQRNYGNLESKGWEINLAVLNFVISLISTQNVKIIDHTCQIQNPAENMKAISNLLKEAYNQIVPGKQKQEKIQKVSKEMLLKAFRNNEAFVRHPMVQVAFKIFEVLKILSVKNAKIKRFLCNFEEMADGGKGSYLVSNPRLKLNEQVRAFSFLRSVYEKVEVVFPVDTPNDSNQPETALQEIWFRIPRSYHQDYGKSLRYFYEKENLEDRPSRLASFFRNAEAFSEEMEQNARAEESNPEIFRLFSPSQLGIYQKANFGLGVVINSFVFSSWIQEAGEFELEEKNLSQSGLGRLLVLASFLMNAAILFGWWRVFLSQKSSIESQNGQRKIAEQNERQNCSLTGSQCLFCQKEIRCFILSLVSLICYLITGSKAALALQLASIIDISQTAAYFARSIVQNIQEITSMALLCFSLSYFYLVLTRELFGGPAILQGRAVPASLAQLFIELSLLLVIAALLFNLIYGAIAKGFCQIKEKSEKKSKNAFLLEPSVNELHSFPKVGEIVSSVCLVCDLKKKDFQQRGLDFQEHVSGAHEIKKYLGFYLSIRQKTKKELSGLEQAMLSKAQMSDFQWIPYKATKGAETIAEKTREELMDTRATFKPIMDELLVQSSQRVLSEMNQRFSTVKASVDSLIQKSVTDEQMSSIISGVLRSSLNSFKEEIINEILARRSEDGLPDENEEEPSNNEQGLPDFHEEQPAIEIPHD